MELTREELEAAHCWEADDERPAPAGDDGLPPAHPLPPGAVARGARAPDRHAAVPAAPGQADPPGRQPHAARLRPRDGRGVRDARRRWPPPAPARRSSSASRASTTSGCGPTCCRRRRWPSTCSAISAADLAARRPRRASLVARHAGHRARRPLRPLARPARSLSTSTASAPSTPRSCSTPAAARTGIVAVDVKYHERRQDRDSRSRATRGATCEVARAVGHLRAGRRRLVCSAAPTSRCMWLEHLLLLSMLQHASRRVDVGPLRRRPPGGQPRRGRLARALPRLPRRRLDVSAR